MMLTHKQLALFWRIWAQAESQDLPAGSSKQQRDMYRRSVILRACGKVSLSAVNPTTDFDRLMYEVATLAGDYTAMGYWCVAKERRTAHMIVECARQIGEIQDHPHGWEYCRATLAQAALPASWEDIPDTLLTSVFEMLDTHRRRMLKRDHGWCGVRHGQPLGFVPDRIYVRSSAGVSYYDPIAAVSAAS